VLRVHMNKNRMVSNKGLVYTHFPIKGPPDLTSKTPIMAFPSSSGFKFHTPSRSSEVKQKGINQEY
jgi:hypothetical protein